MSKDLVEKQEGQLEPWELLLAKKMQEQQMQKAALALGPKFLTFRNGQLIVDDVPIPGGALNVICLAFTCENAWYSGKYDASNIQPPDCWSVYNTIAEMIPNEASKNMQHENCVDCPKFQWGSDPQGGRGKWCKNRYRIAVLGGEPKTAEDILAAEMRMAVIPVTSSHDFDKFMNEAKIQFNRPIFGVQAELKVSPDAKNQFMVRLKPLSLLPGSLIPAVIERVEQAEKDLQYKFVIDQEAAEKEPPKPLKQ